MKPFKCRASGSGQIMTNPKGKTVFHYFKDGIEIPTASFNKLLLAGKLEGVTSTKEEIEGSGLSETCMKYLQRQWIADQYNREKEFTSLAIQKGLMNEEQGITMLSTHLGEMLTKNINRYEDDHLTGTPDCILEDTVFDIKCSYSLFSYVDSDGSDKDYEWQLQCYMELLGLKKAAVVYVLTDTPPSIIQAELRSILWKLQDDADALEIEKGLIKQMTYPDIPLEKRIKIFNFDHDPAMISSLRDRVELCRQYYDQLSL